MHVIATVDILKRIISIKSYHHALLQVNGLSFYGFLLFHNFVTLVSCQTVPWVYCLLS